MEVRKEQRPARSGEAGVLSSPARVAAVALLVVASLVICVVGLATTGRGDGDAGDLYVVGLVLTVASAATLLAGYEQGRRAKSEAAVIAARLKMALDDQRGEPDEAASQLLERAVRLYRQLVGYGAYAEAEKLAIDGRRLALRVGSGAFKDVP